MPRYFLADTVTAETFELHGAEAHHLQKVLRKGPGDTIEISDGKGRFYKGTILQTEQEHVTGRIDGPILRHVESEIPIVLCQALPKGDKMDDIVRKGTELGVAKFLPFIAMRCVSRPDSKDLEKKRQRWQRIAEEASKQAGRSVIPEVLPATDWAGLRKTVTDGTVLIAWEGEEAQGVRGVLAGLEPQTLYLVIGPEGGFDPKEVGESVAQGMISLSLGPRILRTETAGPVLAALALYELGQMEPILKGEE